MEAPEGLEGGKKDLALCLFLRGGSSGKRAEWAQWTDGGKPALVADGKGAGRNGCEQDAIASMDKGARRDFTLQSGLPLWHLFEGTWALVMDTKESLV